MFYTFMTFWGKVPSGLMVFESYKPPGGLICPLVTPLKAGDILDVSSLERLIDYVGFYADGFLVGDLVWGEGLELNEDTRCELVEATLGILAGRRPVLVTLTSETEQQTVAFLNRIKASTGGSAHGGRIFLADYPIYYHSNRGLPQFFESLGRGTEMPFVLVNDPGLIRRRKSRVKHKNIRTSIFKRLTGLDCIQGLIFTGSLARSINYRKASRHRGGFKIYDGDEQTFIRHPSSDGVVAGGANLLPRQWQDIMRSCLNRYDVERQYPDHSGQIWETGVMIQEFHKLYAGLSAAALKRMLHVAGILPNAQVASGTPSTDRAHNQAIETICRKYDLL